MKAHVDSDGFYTVEPDSRPALRCCGCDERRESARLVRVLYRDGTTGPARYCRACREIVDAGQAEHVREIVR